MPIIILNQSLNEPLTQGTSSPFSLGLECIDLRSGPYSGRRLCFPFSKNAAPQAGISDDVKRSWEG